MLVEVVSKGSAARDLIEKREAYQQLPSAMHIVFIGFEPMFVEVSTRSGEAWPSIRLQGADDILNLDAIGFSMSLREIFQDIPAFTSAIRAER